MLYPENSSFCYNGSWRRKNLFLLKNRLERKTPFIPTIINHSLPYPGYNNSSISHSLAAVETTKTKTTTATTTIIILAIFPPVSSTSAIFLVTKTQKKNTKNVAVRCYRCLCAVNKHKNQRCSYLRPLLDAPRIPIQPAPLRQVNFC